MDNKKLQTEENYASKETLKPVITPDTIFDETLSPFTDLEVVLNPEEHA